MRQELPPSEISSTRIWGRYRHATARRDAACRGHIIGRERHLALGKGISRTPIRPTLTTPRRGAANVVADIDRDVDPETAVSGDRLVQPGVEEGDHRFDLEAHRRAATRSPAGSGLG